MRPFNFLCSRVHKPIDPSANSVQHALAEQQVPGQAERIAALKEKWNQLRRELTLIELDVFTEREWRAIEAFARDPSDPMARANMPRYAGTFTSEAQDILMRSASAHTDLEHSLTKYEIRDLDFYEGRKQRPNYKKGDLRYIEPSTKFVPEMVTLLKIVDVELLRIKSIVLGMDIKSDDKLEILLGEFITQAVPLLHADKVNGKPGSRGFLLSRVGGCPTWVMPYDAQRIATAEQGTLIEVLKQTGPDCMRIGVFSKLREQELFYEMPLGRIGVLLYGSDAAAEEEGPPGTMHLSSVVRPDKGKRGVCAALVRS